MHSCPNCGWKPSPEGMAKDYKAGLSLEQVAQARGVAPSTVFYHLKKLGVPRRQGGYPKGKARLDAKIPREMRAKVIEMDAQGLTLQSIGDHFGVCRERIRQILEMHGAEPHRQRQRKAAALREIEAMKEQRQRKEERQGWIEAASALWVRGEHWSVVAEVIPMKNKTVRTVNGKIAWLRNRFPRLFPHRNGVWASKLSTRQREE